MPLKEMITGCLLGDASIIFDPRGRYPHLQFGHGGVQREYLFHKYELLKTICTRPPNFTERSYNGGFVNSGLWTFRTSALPWLLEFYEMFKVDGRKVVTDGILQYFSEETLAYWFMDDGAQSRYTDAAFHCQGFNEESQARLKKWLSERFSIQTRPYTSPQGYSNLHLRKADYLHLCHLIAPFIPECMQYKIVPALRTQNYSPAWSIPAEYQKVCAYCGQGYARLLTCGNPECRRLATNAKNRRTNLRNKERDAERRLEKHLEQFGHRTCTVCQNQFLPRTGRQINCSAECNKEYRRKKQRIGNREAYPARLCVICSKSYIPRIGNQVNCSAECKQEHKRRKMRERSRLIKVTSSGTMQQDILCQIDGLARL